MPIHVGLPRKVLPYFCFSGDINSLPFYSKMRPCLDNKPCGILIWLLRGHNMKICVKSLEFCLIEGTQELLI